MIEEITQAVLSIVESRDKNKPHVAIGFFTSYASVDSDSSGVRFCNLKLHYKDDDKQDIGLMNVPLLYPGSSLLPFDYKLVAGDELIVLFSDRTLEQHKKQGNPQYLKNTIRGSFNHALAIPVVSHRNHSAELSLLNIIDRLLGVLLGDKGNLDLGGTASTGTISQPDPILELTEIRTAIQGAINA